MSAVDTALALLLPPADALAGALAEEAPVELLELAELAEPVLELLLHAARPAMVTAAIRAGALRRSTRPAPLPFLVAIIYAS
jgi:hypothetical protein